MLFLDAFPSEIIRVNDFDGRNWFKEDMLWLILLDNFNGAKHDDNAGDDNLLRRGSVRWLRSTWPQAQGVSVDEPLAPRAVGAIG